MSASRLISARWAVICILGAATALADQPEAVLQLRCLGAGAGAIEAPGPGISCAGSCFETVSTGGTIVLTASPVLGSRFRGWAGDCTGTEPTCTLPLDGSKLVAASFTSARDPLAVIHHFLPGTPDGTAPTARLLASGGYLLGTTTAGGKGGAGTVFRELPDGSEHTILHSFLGGASDGRAPVGPVVEAGGVLYGMTAEGGAAGLGTIYRIGPDGTGFAILHSFAGGPAEGSQPIDGLAVLDGALFGVLSQGGGLENGALFRIGADGGGFTIIHSFTGGAGDGGTPSGPLVAYLGRLYGTTPWSGPGGSGTVFSVAPDGSGFTVLHAFGHVFEAGEEPAAPLTAYAGILYGVTSFGGTGAAGTVFRMRPDGSDFTVLHSFAVDESEGEFPSVALTVLGRAVYGTTAYGGASDGGTVFRVNFDGSGFAVVHSFGPPDGDQPSRPRGGLIFLDGLLLGTTAAGGAGSGTVFGIDRQGRELAVLHSFGGELRDASEPCGALIEVGGALYGMSADGGTGQEGAVFRVNRDGSGFEILHAFTGFPEDGALPTGSLVSLGGFLYGLTIGGGPYAGGTVFRLRPDGSEYSLLYGMSHGLGAAGARFSGSLVALGGALYGATAALIVESGLFTIKPDGSGFQILAALPDDGSEESGPTGSLVACGDVLCGVDLARVFTIHPDGTGLTVLHTFAGGTGDGSQPSGSLLFLDGMLYGMTFRGGEQDRGALFRINPDGSGFMLLRSFGGGADDGAGPIGALAFADGALVGMTQAGGAADGGTVFRVGLDGTGFAVVHSFIGDDGVCPLCTVWGCFGGAAWGLGSLGLTVLGGDLYGVTPNGGLADSGTVFRVGTARSVRRHPPRM